MINYNVGICVAAPYFLNLISLWVSISATFNLEFSICVDSTIAIAIPLALKQFFLFLFLIRPRHCMTFNQCNSISEWPRFSLEIHRGENMGSRQNQFSFSLPFTWFGYRSIFKDSTNVQKRFSLSWWKINTKSFF